MPPPVDPLLRTFEAGSASEGASMESTLRLVVLAGLRNFTDKK